MADVEALENKVANLTEKVRKLESGEITADYVENDNRDRQAETIYRNKKLLREAMEALAEAKAEKKDVQKNP